MLSSKVLAAASPEDEAPPSAADAGTKLSEHVALSRFRPNSKSLAFWVVFGCTIIAADMFATSLYFEFDMQHKMIWSGIYVFTGVTKLCIKWVVIREKKMMLSHGNQLYNVIEYRIGCFRYYDIYVGRVLVNVPFDYVTILFMTLSAAHMYSFLYRYRCSGFEFMNTLFGYTFFSSLLLSFNKTEAIRLTYDKLWWLYLSYFTFGDAPLKISAVYVGIFLVVNITYQLGIAGNYFGIPSVEEDALVGCPGFRHAALAMNATTFCVGFDAQDRYCVTLPKHYKQLTEPRFFRLDEMEVPVPTFDLWKMLQRLECKRHFHRRYDIPDLFKYLAPLALKLPDEHKGNEIHSTRLYDEFTNAVA